MSLLIFVLIVLLIAAVAIAICATIPFPPPVAWARWAIPLVILIVALIVVLQRTGLAST